MILIKDRHDAKRKPVFCFLVSGKYDTYKGSTLILVIFIALIITILGNMILIKDRHLESTLFYRNISGGNMILIKDRHDKQALLFYFL